MKYWDKVKVTSWFYKKQKWSIKAMNDWFIWTLAWMRLYSEKSYKIQLEDWFITDFIPESSLELIK